ncbi:hypothetical protein DL96DRAFT_1698648 [Flagelloscypha sp. PMI_526]|nr:hypothetical protein DL96DRAFT_1698648 [Flagelloscypha sp. PMI_526]
MPPTVASLFGPQLLGAFFNLLLYGVFVLQAFNYWQTYQNDHGWLRALVLYLFLAETANSVATILIVYQPLILQNGTKLPLTMLPTALPADPILTVLISTPVQIFIAYRMKVLSNSWILPVIVTLIALASLGGGLWLGGLIMVIRHIPKNGELETPATVWLSTSAAADVLITAGLSWSLYKSKTGFAVTDTLINRIIRLTIQTGLITSLFAVLDIILFSVVPTSMVNFTMDFMLSKLYSNSLLSTLNARASLNDMVNSRPIQSNVLFGTETGVFTTGAGVESTLKGGSKSILPTSSRDIEVQVSKSHYELTEYSVGKVGQ